jgi:transposase, IS30 family
MKYNQLTAADRGAIEVLLQEQYSVREIGNKLGRHPSTISREIKKRSTPTGYHATVAQINYQSKRRKSRQKKKLNHSLRQAYVVDKLQQGWSPEQISGRMKLVENDWLYVCPETIYQWLYTNEWAFNEEKLYQYLRYGRIKRRKQKGRSVNRSKIPNRVGIENRPRVVGKRKELGHWEGDSVIYPHKMAINTINELTTGLVAFTKLDRKTAKLTAVAMINQLKRYPAKTVTLDNGSEFTNHEEITQATGVQIYFADPYSSWQRGANENANMLLRGYLPKRHNINNLTQDELDEIAEELNSRPRKRLGYYTPTEKYHQLLRKSQSVAVDIRM